jgi:catechol 2,3-dioxygenase-like lactoylglutathione lyase family enzyme
MNQAPFDQQITFLHTQNLDATRDFYTTLLNLPLVRDQGTCLIFSAAPGAYLGFCEHIEPIETGRRVILTLVTDDVDDWYQELSSQGADLLDSPKANPKFNIYHFFLKDPNGYWVEIQRFDQPL